MLQNKFEMPLDLAIKDSKLFNAYFFIIFVLSVISLFISSLHLFQQLGLLIVLTAISWGYIKKHQKNKITGIQLSSDDKWKIEVNNKEFFDAELQGECIVTYYLTWLNFKVTNKFERTNHFHVLLLPDSMGKNELRQLRVRLRFINNPEDEDAEELI